MVPLEGVKVVEFGVMIAVPGAAQTLAQLGAEVTKVEDTRRGDELAKAAMWKRPCWSPISCSTGQM